MNSQHILYEIDIPQEGRVIKHGALFLVAVGATGIGFAVWELYQRFWWNVMNLVVVILLGIFVAGLVVRFREISRWSRQQGCYKVYLDSIGLHVHSDEPIVGRSFSVSVLNLHRLVRKQVSNGENPEYEYFVEEKSGERHRLSNQFTDLDRKAMDIFETIASEYPSVKIVTE